NNSSFVIYDIEALETRVFPLFFRTRRYNSFVKQLLGYGFKRVNENGHPEEFAHRWFRKGMPDKLKYVCRPGESHKSVSPTAFTDQLLTNCHDHIQLHGNRFKILPASSTWYNPLPSPREPLEPLFDDPALDWVQLNAVLKA
ncbi:MAG: heat shock factor family protein, partial [Gammaproteobacteria bacterium]|nr:heat shock factor family protein [Gammaproteobacteria bacterium]